MICKIKALWVDQFEEKQTKLSWALFPVRAPCQWLAILDFPSLAIFKDFPFYQIWKPI